jgi:hypothetical protein
MNIPGGNILSQALSVIKKQSFIYRQFDNRVLNGIGIYVSSYKPDVPLKGSVQPVPRRLYQLHGLDWKKDYITIFSDEVIEGPARDSSGDLIIFDGKIYQALESTHWNPIDGWNNIIFVQIGIEA